MVIEVMAVLGIFQNILRQKNRYIAVYKKCLYSDIKKSDHSDRILYLFKTIYSSNSFFATVSFLAFASIGIEINPITSIMAICSGNEIKE